MLAQATGSALAPAGSRVLPSRAEYFARVRFALEVGDWASLPVLPALLDVPAAELCGSCEGRGVARRRSLGPLRPCRSCQPSGAALPDFDLPRSQRGDSFGAGRIENGVRMIWRGCPHCSTCPVTVTHLGRPLPWSPDCATCQDTGLVLDSGSSAVWPFGD